MNPSQKEVETDGRRRALLHKPIAARRSSTKDRRGCPTSDRKIISIGSDGIKRSRYLYRGIPNSLGILGCSFY